MIRAIATRTVGYPLAMVLGLALAIAISASAGEDPPSEGEPARQVIPYDGVLELDGVAVNGAYTVRFQLYHEPGTANPIWESDIEVEIVGGRFSALLGADNPLEPAQVLPAPELYLSIAIENPENPDANDFFVLANQQRIVPTPLSYVASEAPNFLVNDSLDVLVDATVRRDLYVTGEAEVGSLEVLGNAQIHQLTGSQEVGLQVADDLGVTGTLDAQTVRADTLSADAITIDGPANVAGLSAEAYMPPYQNWAAHGTGDGGAAIYNDNNSYKTLMIVGNNSNGGVRRVRVWDDLSIAGNVRESCDWTGYTCDYRYCPEGQFLAGFDFDTGSNQACAGWPAVERRYRIYCCAL